MLTLIQVIQQFFKYLNSNESVTNLATSMTFAIGGCLVPFNSLFHPLLVVVLILLRGNVFIFIFSVGIFKYFISLTYPILHVIGENILTKPSLNPIFTDLYQLPMVNFLNWNNTVSMGGYLLFLVGLIPMFYIFKKLISLYRTYFATKRFNSKKWMGLNFLNWFIKGSR